MPGRPDADTAEVSGNLDERLLAHWIESGRRQQAARTRLERSSLPLERFEGWALDLIADSLTECRPAPAERPPVQLGPRDG